MPVTLPVADEEVNGVLIAVIAVGDSVLTRKACGLDVKVAGLCPLGGFGKLFGAD